MKKPLLLSLILFLCCSLSYGQEDVTFWFVAPDVSQDGSLMLDRPIDLRLTAFSAPATVTISQPAGGGMPTTTVTIPANSTTSVDLTTWLASVENTPPNTILNKGILIQSTAPISAYYSVVGSPTCLCNPEDFVLKGKNALGTDFWIPGQNVLSNDPGYTPTPYNAFDIVATQNLTTVTITPAKNIVGHPAGVPFTILLNTGQTYSATAASTLAAQHLVGSRVTSDKPIAITEKDDLLGFTSLGIYGADLIGDQIVPTNVLGTEYIPMYGALTAPGDQLFITATQPGTTVKVNGTLVTTIATAGSTYQMTAPSPSCYIQTNYPVYVYQLSGIHSEVGSALLPQINCTGSTSVSIQQSSTINFQVNLLVKTVATGSFLVNGVGGVVTPAMFSTVPGTGGIWSAALVSMAVSSYPLGSVLTISNTSDVFQMGYLSSGPPNSGASFGYFSNYGGINPNPRTTTPSVCVGDSIKLFSDTISSASYYWVGAGGFTSTLQNPFITGAVVADSGLYEVYVTTPGCEDSGTVFVAVHPYPKVFIGNDTLICGSATLTLKDLDTVEGTDTYLWSTGSTSSTITVSGSGTYWEQVNNAGCKTTDTIHISIVPLTAPTVTPVTYCQYATAVPLTATGTGLRWYTAGTGGTYTTTAPTPSTAASGVFTWYVSSSSGPCESARVPLTVTVNPLPSPPGVADPNPYCFGQPFVPFTVTGTGVQWYTTATGGTGSGMTPTVNTSIPGNDTFYATQTVNGCEGPRGMTVITVLPPITPAFTYATHLGCHGDTIVFNNTSTGATRYLWVYGDGYSDTTFNPVHIYATQDSFRVKLIAINNQCDDSVIRTIYLIHPLQAGFTLSPEIVCQKNPVTFTNTSTGSGLTYLWLFGNGATDNTANPVYTYDNSGVYKVRLVATNDVPCRDTATATVYVDSTTAIGLWSSDSVLCRSTSITFLGSYTSIGDTGVTWNFGDGDSIVNVNPVTHSFEGIGKFVVTVIPHYRVCRDTSMSKQVTIIGAPALYLGRDTSICPGSEGIVIGDDLNAENPSASWKWNTGQATPKIVVSAPGTYYASINIDGCVATDTIHVLNDCYIDIPNVFTPNGDGLNDYFFPRQYLTRGLTSFKLDIYNRWGQLIFESTSLDGAGWDGRFNNMEQPVGVYVYIIDAAFKDGQKDHRQGNVTLLR